VVISLGKKNQTISVRSQNVTISVKIPREMYIQIKNVRGFASRSEFIRHAILFCLSRKECVDVYGYRI